MRTGGKQRREGKSRDIQEWGDPWHFHGHCQLLASEWMMTQFTLFRRGNHPGMTSEVLSFPSTHS